jgi:hypothetical protein
MDFHTGTLCGIVDAKPNFKTKCKDILLESKVVNQIMLTRIELEAVKRLRKRAYTQSAISLLVSLLLMAGSYYLNSKILEAGYIAALPLIVFGTALITLSTAFGPLVTLKRKMKVAKAKLYALENVLNMYSIIYSIDYNFYKEVHDEQLVETTLEYQIKGRKYKATKNFLIRPEGIILA